MDDNSPEPRVGLIAANKTNRNNIEKVLSQGGYQVSVAVGVDHLEKDIVSNDDTVDAWLLDLKEVDIQAVLDAVVEFSNKPLLVNDEIPASENKTKYDYWQKRLLEKLEIVAVAPQSDSNNSKNNSKNNSNPDIEKEKQAVIGAEKVWVLAASLGGPDAVSRFLKTLPSSLPLAMIYAQHTQTNFDQHLATTIGQAQAYPVQLLNNEQLLSDSNVYVVPVNRQVRFLPYGRTVATRKPWKGIYQPSIDQVIADLARLYRNKLGVIVFSGMCNDGEIGVRVAKACGSTIWAQTPESCASPDMPESIINTGCVSRKGTPEELALLLSQQYNTYFENTEPAIKKAQELVNTKIVKEARQ